MDLADERPGLSGEPRRPHRGARGAALLSPAYRFGEGASEDALRQVYLAKYGVRKGD